MSNGHQTRRIVEGLIAALALVVGMSATASGQRSQPAPLFTKQFSPATIGPTSVSTATFTITNTGQTPVTGLAFTDILPAGITIATPASASTTCLDGVVGAPDGGGIISLSGARLGGNDSSCTVDVNVTSSTVGVHTNPSITLTSSAGTKLSDRVDLTVDATVPGFRKAFSPASVPLGGRSTLTFTIDNSANGGVAQASFTDTLPAGMVIANPSDAATTCSGTYTAASGTRAVTLGTSILSGGARCTASVDVIAIATATNVAELLAGLFTLIESGKATASLTATVSALSLVKSFTDDPVPPGGTVTLQFTITNRDRSFAASNIDFTDPLPAGLSVTGTSPTPPNAPTPNASPGSGTPRTRSNRKALYVA